MLCTVALASLAAGSCSGSKTCRSDGDCAAGMRCNMTGACEPRVCNGDVAWEPDVRPLLASRCGGCHTDPPRNSTGGGPPPGGFRLDRFEDTGTVLGAKSKIANIMTRVTAGTMPPSPLPKLSQSERDLLETWACLDAPLSRDAGPIDSGTMDGGCEDVAWIPDIEPLFVSNCGRCHTHPPKNDIIDSGTYAGVVPPYNFRLDRYEDSVEPDGGMVTGAYQIAIAALDRVTFDAGPMPPPPLPRLTSEEQKRIADWVCNGARRIRRSACDAGSAVDSGC